MISIDDFSKVEIKVGKILTAEKVENADKLLRLTVDFGLKPIPPMPESSPTDEAPAPEMPAVPPMPEKDIRQIVSGIALHFPDPAVLIGKLCPFVTNLEPRTIRGLESQGMIMAASTTDAFSLFSVDESIPPGTKVK